MMQSKVDKVLSDLYNSNKKLAEHLLEKQIISAVQLKKILGDEQIPLGQLLIEERLILKYELELALLEQQFNNKKLGEILVAQQSISPEQLEKILIKQAWQVEKYNFRTDDTTTQMFPSSTAATEADKQIAVELIQAAVELIKPSIKEGHLEEHIAKKFTKVHEAIKSAYLSSIVSLERGVSNFP